MRQRVAVAGIDQVLGEPSNDRDFEMKQALFRVDLRRELRPFALEFLDELAAVEFGHPTSEIALGRMI